MDTDLLKTFLEVSHTRHFGKAAENLYLTQSAISARIRQLENLIGCSLFVRTRHNIRLTAAGERLIPHAEAILTTLHRVRQDVVLEAHQRHIALGATSNVWDTLLLEQVTSLLASDPSLSLRAESMSAESLSHRLLERTLDLCVMFDPPKMNELSFTVLKSIELILVTTEQQDDQWLPAQKQIRWLLIEWGTQFATELSRALPGLPPPALQTNSVRIALDTLLKLGGCTYLPDTIAAPHIESGQLWPVKASPIIRRNIYIVWRGDNRDQATLYRLIERLSSAV